MDVTLKIICACCGISERQGNDYIRSGLFKRKSKGKYDLPANVLAYWQNKTASLAGTDHKAVRLEQDRLKNELLQIEIAEANGTLVKRDEYEGRVADMARKTRDAMFNLIPRSTPLLAAESDPGKIQAILDTEIRTALENMRQYLSDED
jgi:hypothetical protein